MAYDANNGEVLESLQVGDLVEFDRGLYQHWAVYIGGWKVVEVSGGIEFVEDEERLLGCLRGEASLLQSEVKVSKFWELTHGDKATKNNKLDEKYRPKEPEDIKRDAMAMVGQKIEYNLLTNNCEHYVNLWRYDQFVSPQADRFTTLVRAEDVVNVLTRAGEALQDVARLVSLDITDEVLEHLRSRLLSNLASLE